MPDTDSNGKKVLIISIAAIFCTVIVAAFFSVIKITIFGFIILVFICIIAFLVIVLFILVPKGKRIKKIEDIWNSLIVEKVNNFCTILNKDILNSVKHLRKIVLFLIITNIISISLIPTCYYFTKNHYVKIIEKERRDNQEKNDILFKIVNDKNTKISELETENRTLKPEKTSKEEMEGEDQKHDSKDKSIKSLLERGKRYYIEGKRYNDKKDLVKRDICFRTAKSSLDEAINSSAKREVDSESLGYCYYYRGRICRYEKKFGAAIDYSKKAYENFQKGRYINKGMVGYSAYEIGIVKSKFTEDYEESIVWLKKSLDIFVEIKFEKEEAMVLHELGLAYARNKDKENSLEYLNSSIEKYDGLNLFETKNDVMKDRDKIRGKKLPPYYE